MKRIGYYSKKFFQVLFLFGGTEVVRRAIQKLRNYRLIPDQNLLYSKWLESKEKFYLLSEEKIYSKKVESFSKKPKISILMPVYNIDPKYLKPAIDSILDQWYQNWELCLSDDYSTNPATIKYLDEIEKNELTKSGKIKITRSSENNNISVATNKAFEISTGEYVLLMDNDDFLRHNALYEVVKEINEKGDQDLIYYDEDKLDVFGNRTEAFFKPDFSPELLWSMMYPTHAVFSRSIFEKAGKLRKGYEGSQDYDLVLRVMEQTDKITHISKILYSWRKVKGSTAESLSSKSYAATAAKNSLADAITRRNLTGQVLGEVYPFRVKLHVNTSKTVEIVVPIKDKIHFLQKLYRSILDENTYPPEKLRLTIVDHNSIETETHQYLEKLQSENKIKTKVLKYEGEFNFSKINNFAVKNSDSDFILFLNNDIEVISKGFIEELLQWSMQDKIGAAGGLLLYPDKKVQHAGIILGYGGVANHVYYRLPFDSQFYFSQLHSVRNYIAVTAAAMMIERKKFNEVDGFEEELPRAFQDVDLCLKLYKKGYRNVYTPHCRMIHYESQTRDPQVTLEENAYMNKKWKDLIQNDPYYNPNLSKDVLSGLPFSIDT